ncbi:MAG: helix-turn-helix transcriptional regulator [Ruminococcaceae bacterium]|nr:helix-turn-helix transcriptional regulator [Oscillospiraceae bacterium]
MVDFGNTLKKLRLQEGYTQQQLADKLGVTKSVISYYELQERYPSPDVLIRMAYIFHVTTDYLLGLTHKELVDLEGLDDEDIVTVKRMITALRSKNENRQ